MPAAFAQFEKWEIHQAYQNTEQVEETNNHVFALADSSLYIYGKEDQNVITYSRKNGLSDNKIKVIRYHASSHTLVIAYRNGNIDLLGDEGLYNLPFLKNSTSIQNKTLNDIYFYQDYAYLSSETGIVVIHVKKKEITDTYKIGAVRSTCILNGYLYALTDKGIKRGKTDNNLLDIGNWSDYNLETDLFKMENVNLETLGFGEDTRMYKAIITPIDIAGERLGTLFEYRSDREYDIDDIILTEYGTTVVGLEMMRSVNEENEEEKRKVAIVRSAINTLSYSELEAILHIFDELDGNEGILVASRIADRVGITRSVIVNALRKFESAGVIESRSSGMKGTYIKVVNDVVFDELDRIRNKNK